MIRTSALALCGMLSLVACKGTTEASSQSLETRNVATGLDTPWEILWGPDNWIWMTERGGRVSRVNPQSTGELQEVYTIPDVYENGESGLLGMVLHPSFTDSPYVYVGYTYLSGGQARERFVRYRYENGTLTSPLVLLEGLAASSIHDGSRLLILPDRTLYITTGDASNQSLPQDLQSLNGKILRMNLDGTVPADNPFPGSFIWSFGHRNPQGLVFANGRLYSSEHGPATDDEVNIIEKGRNYGWPNVAGFCNTTAEMSFCTTNNVVEPIAAWTPTIAPCGLDYYSSSLIAEWNNSLLLVCLKDAKLLQLRLDPTGGQVIEQKTYFEDEFGRLRDLCISPDGKVYLATSNRDGRGSPGAQDDRIIEVYPTVTSVEGPTERITFQFALHQNYPNPFNPATTIRFSIDRTQTVALTVFDILGREVETLVDATLHPGEHSVIFEPEDRSSGVFLLRLEGESSVLTRKVVYLR